MFREKNERLALVISTAIFGILGLFQLFRALAQVPVSVGDQAVPAWVSIIIGMAALTMAFWLGKILRDHRPLI